MSNLLHNIANIGIEENTPFRLRNKLKVFNIAVVVIFLISLFYFASSLLYHFYLSMVLTLFSLASNVFAFICVKKKWYDLAFHYGMWYGFAFLTGFILLFGSAMNSYYYFLFMPVVCIVLFDNFRTASIYFCICAVVLMLNVYYMDHCRPYYQVESWIRYLGYPTPVATLLLVFLSVRQFKKENLRYSDQVDSQNRALEEKNREITDSINYAKKIQDALIPSEQEFTGLFKEAFVLFRPKDIVSGDFYWATKKGPKIYYATADCTGHGVPGGFMTMLGMSFLDELINEKNMSSPAQILDALRERLIHTLKQTGTSGENQDGMDIVLCCLDAQNNTIDFAAGNNALHLLRDGHMTEYKGDKQPCGFYHDLRPFTDHRVELMPGDQVYTFSDGYADQFGGPKGKKFKYKQLQETLIVHSQKPMQKQKSAVNAVFEAWKKPLEQVDDVLLIGVKI